jgi:hypothetical protein
MEMTYEGHIGSGTTVIVEFDYTPEESEVRYPPDAAQPGFPEDVEITAILIGEDDIYDDLSYDCINRLEKDLLDWLHNG